jgi:alpha-L-fucosidase 2
MNIHRQLTALSIAFLAVCFVATTVHAKATSQQLWYEQAAKAWNEAVPIGNGTLGAMVFGGVQEERIQFNEATLYAGEPHDYSRPGASEHLATLRQLLFDGKQEEAEALGMKEFMSDPLTQVPYQDFGDIILKFPDHEIFENYRRSLDIEDAVARTTYTANGVHYTREMIASYPDQIIAIHITADTPGKVSFTAGFKTKHANSSIESVNGDELRLQGLLANKVLLHPRKKISIDVKKPLHFEARMQLVTDAGSIKVTQSELSVTDANAVTLIVTAATSYKNFQDISGDPSAICERILKATQGKDWSTLETAHREDYQALFQRVWIDLGRGDNEALPTNERLNLAHQSDDHALSALLYQYGRYLLIACSRPGGQPANLQGIWNDSLSPPWGSRYTVNINTEMNYWPAELTNLAECHEPLFDAMEDLVITGKQTAKNHYNARGWVLHHNFDLWRGTAPINDSNHGIWPTGGAWLCQHMWMHYEFSGDRAFLERAYPTMKEAALFFVDYLIEDPRNDKGWLISTPSHSPEHGGLVAGPTMDHQLIRDLFNHVIEASEILNKDADLREQLITMRAKIAPNQIGQHGQLQEWLEDKDDPKSQHRHVSHLWGLHPGNEITWKNTPELFDAAKQSLIFRGDAATGWSMGWKVNFWARFLDGDHAILILDKLMRPAAKKGGGLYPNLFDAHPPFQIDGNFGVTAGITEMLLQSHVKDENGNPLLHLLPALPSTWPAGSIRGIRARGGFEVDLAWANGELTAFTILSISGNPCTIYSEKLSMPIQLPQGESYTWSKQQN